MATRLTTVQGVLTDIKRVGGLARFGISKTQPVQWFAIPLAECSRFGISPVAPYSTNLPVPCWVRTEDGYAITATASRGPGRDFAFGPRSITCPMGVMVESPVCGKFWLVVNNPSVSPPPGKALGSDFPKGYDWHSDPRTRGYIKHFLATMDEVSAGQKFFGLKTVSQCRRLFKAMMTDAKVAKEVNMNLREKMGGALKRRGIAIEDGEEWVLDSYIGIVEDNKGAADIRAVELAMKGLDRLSELLVDTKTNDGGGYWHEITNADDTPALPGGQNLPTLPPLPDQLTPPEIETPDAGTDAPE